MKTLNLHERQLHRKQPLDALDPMITETVQLAPWMNDPVMVSMEPSLAEHPDFHDGWGAIRERCLPHTARAATAAYADTSQEHAADKVVTDQDKERLEHLLRAPGWQHAKPRESALLREELARAAVVAAQTVSPNVVTMQSRVLCRDVASGARAELQLVYPWETHARKATLSVLSDLGLRMLGTSVGQPIELPKDARWRPRLRVESVRYQPERDGQLAR